MSEKVGYAPTRPCVQPANLNIGLAMTDRELLELAAKAAGIPTIPCTCSDTRWPFKHDEEKSGKRGHWNPLEDDGDALRLAVELRLVLHIWDDGELASAAKTLPDGGDPPSEDGSLWSSADAHASGGLAAATRRAIVRAAAEIGAAAKKGTP